MAFVALAPCLAFCDLYILCALLPPEATDPTRQLRTYSDRVLFSGRLRGTLAASALVPWNTCSGDAHAVTLPFRTEPPCFESYMERPHKYSGPWFLLELFLQPLQLRARRLKKPTLVS